MREEEKASENWRRRREANKVEVAPGVTVGILRRFMAAPTEKSDSIVDSMPLSAKCEVLIVAIRRGEGGGGGGVGYACDWRYTKPSLAIASLCARAWMLYTLYYIY